MIILPLINIRYLGRGDVGSRGDGDGRGLLGGYGRGLVGGYGRSLRGEYRHGRSNIGSGSCGSMDGDNHSGRRVAWVVMSVVMWMRKTVLLQFIMTLIT